MQALLEMPGEQSSATMLTRRAEHTGHILLPSSIGLHLLSRTEATSITRLQGPFNSPDSNVEKGQEEVGRAID